MTVPDHLRKRKAAGLPPPATFSLSTLPDDAHLTQYEVAQARRQTLSWTEKCRLNGKDGLEWVYVDGRPRCLVGSLKQRMVGSPDRAPPPAMAAAKVSKAVGAKPAPAKPVPPAPRPKLLKAKRAAADAREHAGTGGAE